MSLNTKSEQIVSMGNHRSKSTDLYRFDKLGRQNPGTETSSAEFLRKAYCTSFLSQRSEVGIELFIHQRQAAQFYLLNSITVTDNSNLKNQIH